MIKDWEKEQPGRMNNIFGGLSNVEISHLADPSIFNFKSLATNK